MPCQHLRFLSAALHVVSANRPAPTSTEFWGARVWEFSQTQSFKASVWRLWLSEGAGV